MFFCGSYSYLKEKVVNILEEIGAEEKKTFIVHTNQMKRYLKEFIVEKTGSLFNAEFFTLIDISKRITGIEPLQDFEREMIFKRFLMKYNLDGLSEEFGLIIQQIKEYEIPVDSISQPFFRDIIYRYEQFKSDRYFDREDTHAVAVRNKTEFNTDHLFIFGIKSVPALHQKLLRKVAELSRNKYIFLPLHFDSGYYQNYDHFKEVRQFYEELGDFPEVEKEEDINIKVSRYIYKFDYNFQQKKNENIKIVKTQNEISELLFVATEITRLVAEGISPSKICIIIPEIERYIPYIQSIFPSFSIPYHLTENSRFIDTPLYSKLFSIFELKRENFSRETVLNILSDELLEIKKTNLLERQILSLPDITEGLEAYKQFAGLWELLKTADEFPQEGRIEEFIHIAEKINRKFIKNREVKEFLDSVISEMKEKKLFKDLFKVITYEEFLTVLKTFFLKENREKRPDYETVKVLSPTSAEGNNFSHIFFLDLTTGSFPKISDEILPIGDIDYPYHLLMQQISNFCALLDRGKKLYLSFTEESIYGGVKSTSFFVEEIVRITGNQINSLDGYKTSSKWLKIIHAPLIKEQIPQLKKIWDVIKTIEKPKKEKFRLNISVPFPLQPTKFSVYATCPYRFFLEHITGFLPEKTVDMKRLPSEKIGEDIHGMLLDFYASMPERNRERYINETLPDMLEKLRKRLEGYLSQLLPYYRPFEKHRINSMITNLKEFVLSDVNRLKRENKTIKKDFLEKNFSNRYFSGRVDRVEVDEHGYYHIYDYKTTEKKINLRKEIKDKYIQLIIYKNLLNKYPVKSVGILAVNSRDGNFFHTVDDKEIEGWEIYLKTLLKQLKAGMFHPVENEGCSYCPFEYFCVKEVS
ncbi:hypothetical protein GWK41_03355 [Persephonella atlantica]|uniref:PD-(D/E)XK endonuclease-like domain-containing protein n=1 Tax=Persephonella atlantica TaxID=2699429 RepID=A0ABS1GGN9_9AQUI|nr:PD-(D/E)XK nuclease family protein [Persephonella atlantica]MBK3332103.1 hypothetical protein [Persephonella atlantica]